ncbi:MAG: hypothetical protein QXU74_03110 [Candidatus Aenigmatarchaeota archaeon]
MLEPRALEFFIQNSDKIESFLDKLKNVENFPTIITLDFIKSLLQESLFEIEEIKKRTIYKTSVSVEDISKILIERYEKIKSFFSYRLDIVNLISINKISEKTRKFSLIVIVREIDKQNKTILVEDLTGEIIIHIPDNLINYLVQDEVIGLSCERRDGELWAANILWPDVPLKRSIRNLEEDVYCLFASKNILEKECEEILGEIKKLNFKFLFVFLFLDDILEREKIEEIQKKLPLNSKLILITNQNFEGILSFSSPAFLALEKKIVLLLIEGKFLSNYENLGKDCGEIMLNLLKKRHLNPIFRIENLIMEDRFLIDPIPDIFVSANFGSSSLINYKGITIISCGSSEKLFWIVNLKTRESLKISLT